MSDWLNQWSISGTLGAVMLAVLGWLRRRSSSDSQPWHRRLFQVISGSGRVLVAEDALDFTNRYYETTVKQRDRAFAEVERQDAEIVRLEMEITRLRSLLPPGS